MLEPFFGAGHCSCLFVADLLIFESGIDESLKQPHQRRKLCVRHPIDQFVRVLSRIAHTESFKPILPRDVIVAWRMVGFPGDRNLATLRVAERGGTTLWGIS